MTIRKKDAQGEERRGEVDLSTGEYEVLIKVKTYGDEQVGFKLIEREDHSTCSNLEENRVEIVLHSDGFIIRANIESETVKFKWWVE